MTKARLYSVLKEIGYYLPKITDKSVTIDRLIAIGKHKTACVRVCYAERIHFKSPFNRNFLMAELKKLTIGLNAKMWYEGAIPSKQYLLGLIYYFDPNNRVFYSLSGDFKVPRVLKKCLRCAKKNIRVIENRIEQKEKQKGKAFSAFGSTVENPLSSHKRLCKTRNKFVKLKRVTLKDFQSAGLDKDENRIRLLRRIHQIDRLIDVSSEFK